MAKPKAASGMYKYKPLETGHIRLLKLLPGQSDEELKCALIHAPLDPFQLKSQPNLGRIRQHMKTMRNLVKHQADTPFQQFPEYEAISYCWGDPNPSHSIHCEGRSTQITTNLANGLKQLRYEDRPRTLWADQICINQADISERSSQVNIMGKIFKQANCVLIWLGPDDPASPQAPLAMSIIEKIATLPPRGHLQAIWREDELVELGFPYRSSPAWRAFTELVTLPYFNRVWILQEVFLASSTVILWGATLLRIEQLGELTKRLAHLPSKPLGLTSSEVPNFSFSMGIRSFRQQWSLLELAHVVTRYRKAKDPRDKIFALLGMVESNSDPILADYSKSVVEVYTSAAHYFIRESPHSLIFLYYAGTQRLTEHSQQWETWPSWVPSFPVDELSPIYSKRPRFRADGKQPRSITQLPHEHKQLRVDGVQFSRLSHVITFENVGKPARYSTLGHHILKAHALLRASWNRSTPQHFDEPSFLPPVIRTTLNGSYEEIDIGPKDVEFLAQPHNMYEDFIVLMVYTAVFDLEVGEIASLQALKERFKIADQAVAHAWLSQPGNSVAKDTSLEDPCCLTVAEIKQEYKNKTNSDSTEYQSLIERSKSTLAKLDWPNEDLSAAAVLITDLLHIGGQKDRFYNCTMRQSLERAFFTTKNGSIGIGPPAIQPDDVVVILFGGRAPFILRSTDVDGEYHLIGDCYVDGIMHGEYIEKLKADGKFEERRTSFTLV
jgi:hypothetical protein